MFVYLFIIAIFDKHLNLETMKTFKLTIFKANEAKDEKTVKVETREQLANEKNAFWMESPYKKGISKNWMGTKRIR